MRHQINLKVDSEFIRRVDRLAKRWGVSRQNAIRVLVAEAGEDTKTRA